jgi:formate dehydrogenase major subunit
LVDINKLTNDAWDKRSGTSEFKAASIRIDKLRLDSPTEMSG